ncbi:MAG: Tim44/TimA family putative adaptor protein [Paracoccaceae bacterium]
MNSALIQLLVLAGVAVFLILRLKNVLGTRDGFEPPRAGSDPAPAESARRRSGFDVVEGGPDLDILDHVDEGTKAAKALSAMKAAEPGFNLGEFMQGAGAAYEMILMAFERGDLEEITPFLSEEVMDVFVEVVSSREDKGLKIKANFVGLRELKLLDAKMDDQTKLAEITMRFVGELTSVVYDAAGDIVEGDPNQVKRQKDIWTFRRVMGSEGLNWQLVATGG